MKCVEHDHILYDRVWWICRHCDDYYREYRMTNAVKAQVIVAVNILLALAVSFGAPLTDQQQGLIVAAVNALLGVYVALTYKDSPKRIAE